MNVLEADMRVIVRLLGETAALPGGLMNKKCYLLDGLCDIAGANEWTWALFGAGKKKALKGFLRRKIDASPALPPELSESASLTSQPDSLPRAASPHVVFSLCSLDADTESQIVLRRDPNDPPYTAREVHLASLVLDEIPWLHHRVGRDRSEAPKLSPRQRLTLDLLLLGLGRKEIADQLSISPGTVVGYIGDLYRHFGVNSQAELMRIRFQNHKRL
jgi:DNA-binding CsgD family transcriptional regulator